MRIAVSGTHRTGKTTLVDALINELPQYVCVDEPYWRMVEEGFEFNHPPSLSDFEVQLECSLESLNRNEDNVVFDRCPVDILAYILTHKDAGMFNIDDCLPRIQTSLESLDFVFYLPIKNAFESEVERRRVDEKLSELLMGDIYDFDLEVICLEGETNKRLFAATRLIAERTY